MVNTLVAMWKGIPTFRGRRSGIHNLAPRPLTHVWRLELVDFSRLRLFRTTLVIVLTLLVNLEIRVHFVVGQVVLGNDADYCLLVVIDSLSR